MSTWKEVRTQLCRCDSQKMVCRQHTGQSLLEPAIRKARSGARTERFRIISFAACFFIFSFVAIAQQPTCSVTSGSPTVHAEGLAEQVGDITLTCSGGSGTVNTILSVTLNANI